MSDYPNGTPPGQNNIDATTEPYVPKENDPSASAQKPDTDRPQEDNIEAREEPAKEVQQELAQAAGNIVEPGSVEDKQQSQGEPPPLPGPDSGQVSEDQDTARKAEAGQLADSRTPAARRRS